MVEWPVNRLSDLCVTLGWQAVKRARSMQLRCQHGVYEGVLFVLAEDVLTLNLIP